MPFSDGDIYKEKNTVQSITWVHTCETETTVWPAYGEAAMLGSLFIVEVFSDAGNEVGDVAPDTDDPGDK